MPTTTINLTIDKTTVGLGNVDNTALTTWAGSGNITTLGTIASGVWHGTAIEDAYIASAAVWNAKQDPLGFTAEDTANKGIANGYASLDVTGKVPSSQLPAADVLTTSDIAEGTNLYYTDARVQAYADTLYSPLGHTHTFASLTSKPTTLAGYGITDGQAIGAYIKADGTIPLTANWAAGNFSITANAVIVGSTANTIAMGSASGGSGLITGTSHATKAFTSIGSTTTFTVDEVNKRIGVGIAAPIYDLHVEKSVNGEVGTATRNTNSGNSAGCTGYYLNDAGSFVAFGLTSSAYTTSGLLVASRGILSTTATNGIIVAARTAATPIIFAIGGFAASNEVVRITTAGIGIGVTTATALVHLKAGTATAGSSPLKLTAGTNLTTPEAGVLEYNGTSLFFTPSTTRYNLLLSNSGLTGGQTIVGGTAASETLTLSSTSNATKGKILFGTSGYDEVQDFIGIGTATPSYPVHLQKNLNQQIYFISENTSSGTSAIARIGAIAGGKTALWGITGTSYTSGANLYQAPSRAWLQCDGSGGMLISSDAAATSIVFAIGGLAASNEVLRIRSAGLGIGVTVPSASLHIKAGTATANSAPIKLTAGTNLTTPENGAIEYDGTNLYFTIGGVRKTVTLV